ncbi:MAG: hypothetical protein LQ337_001539 [Flavoplaca oasis]|nr:MAG: hypothetical protein LQ337_001539 [Flavoplaca oasis]
MDPRPKGERDPRAQHSTTFLDFPAEIRLEIYKFVLCFDGVEPKIDWVDYAMDHRKHYEARERGSYREPEPKPRPWPIEVRLDCLTPHRPFFGTPDINPPPHHQTPPDAPISKGKQPLVPLASVLAIIGTCRQIYLETKGIFWSKNKFIVDNMWGFHYFAYGLGPHRLRYINCVGNLWNLYPWVDTNTDAASQTELLLSFRFRGMSPMSSFSPWLSPQYDFVYKVLDAVDSQRGDFDSRLKCFRESSGNIDLGHDEDDRTANAVLNPDGNLRDSIDILGEAICEYHEQFLERPCLQTIGKIKARETATKRDATPARNVNI